MKIVYMYFVTLVAIIVGNALHRRSGEEWLYIRGQKYSSFALVMLLALFVAFLACDTVLIPIGLATVLLGVIGVGSIVVRGRKRRDVASK
jgi:hypothetical protein